MRPTTLLGIAFVGVFGFLVVTSFGEQVAGWETFDDATASGRKAHVVGTWVRDAPSSYDPSRNVFTFTMADTAGTVRPVLYANPKPANFEDAERVVVQGQMAADGSAVRGRAHPGQVPLEVQRRPRVRGRPAGHADHDDLERGRRGLEAGGRVRAVSKLVWVGAGLAVVAAGAVVSDRLGSRPETPAGGPLPPCGPHPNCARVGVDLEAEPDTVLETARQALVEVDAAEIERTDGGWTATSRVGPFTDDLEVAVEATETARGSGPERRPPGAERLGRQPAPRGPRPRGRPAARGRVARPRGRYSTS